MIDQYAVAALVYGVAEHRVVAGALLPQVSEQRVCRTPVDVIPNSHRE